MSRAVQHDYELRINKEYTNLLVTQKPESLPSDDLSSTIPLYNRRTIFTKDFMNKIMASKNESPLILPPNVRYIERSDQYITVLVEEPPAIRTIFVSKSMGDEVNRARSKNALELYDPDKIYRSGKKDGSHYSFTLAMPYVLHFLSFGPNHSFAGGYVFFRKSQLRGFADELYKAPLNNINESQNICYGSGAHRDSHPSLSLAVEAVLNSWWSSVFNTDYTYNSTLYTKKGIEGLTSFMEWQYYSRKNPLFVYDVPWIKYANSVGQQLDNLRSYYHRRERSANSGINQLMKIVSKPTESGEKATVGKRSKREYDICNDICQSYIARDKNRQSYVLEVGFEFKNNKGESLIIDSFNGIVQGPVIKSIQIDRNGKSEIWKATDAVWNYIVESHRTSNYEKEITVDKNVKIKTGDIIELKDPIYQSKTYRKVGLIRRSRDKSNSCEYEVQLSGNYYFDNKIQDVKIITLDEPEFQGIKLKAGDEYVYAPVEPGTCALLVKMYKYTFSEMDINSSGSIVFRFRDYRGERFTLSTRNNNQSTLLLPDQIRPIRTNPFYSGFQLFISRSSGDVRDYFYTYNGRILCYQASYRKITRDYLSMTQHIVKKDKFFLDGPVPQEFKIGDNVVLVDYNNPVEMLRVKTITSFIHNSENGNIDFVLSDKDGNMHRHTYVIGETGTVHTGSIRKIVSTVNRISSGTKIVAKTSEYPCFKKGSVNIIIGFITDTGGEPMVLCSNTATLWMSDIQDNDKFERCTMKNKKWKTLKHEPIQISKIETQVGDIVKGDGVHMSATDYYVVKTEEYVRPRLIPHNIFNSGTNYPESYTFDKYVDKYTTFAGLPAPRVAKSDSYIKGYPNMFGLIFEDQRSMFYFNENLRRV